jgi:hypothetical protein
MSAEVGGVGALRFQTIWMCPGARLFGCQERVPQPDWDLGVSVQMADRFHCHVQAHLVSLLRHRRSLVALAHRVRPPSEAHRGRWDDTWVPTSVRRVRMFLHGHRPASLGLLHRACRRGQPQSQANRGRSRQAPQLRRAPGGINEDRHFRAMQSNRSGGGFGPYGGGIDRQFGRLRHKCRFRAPNVVVAASALGALARCTR